MNPRADDLQRHVGEADTAPVEAHDPDFAFARWREAHLQEIDEDYRAWRATNERHFPEDFEGWRRERHAQERSAAGLPLASPREGAEPAEDTEMHFERS